MDDLRTERFTVHIYTHVNRADKCCFYRVHNHYYITGNFQQAIWSDCTYSSFKAWKSLCLRLPRGETGISCLLNPTCQFIQCWILFWSISPYSPSVLWNSEYKRGTSLLWRMGTYRWCSRHFHEFNNTRPNRPWYYCTGQIYCNLITLILYYIIASGTHM